MANEERRSFNQDDDDRFDDRPRRGPARGGGPGARGQNRGGPRRLQRRRRVPPVKINEIDWKNLRALRYFLEDDGSLRPRRKTGASAKYQRKVALAVKRARHMALLPFTHAHSVERTGQSLERDQPDLRGFGKRVKTEETQ
ncbi:MAG TPA: 30S ribosomal protein S18 [Anaerolineae bacterium]|nr:30S ribosomal protein S18 [Anaerolineae bacterium]HMR66890.1 30S ribosomal protein S18 [Anaerolineae bacterium]